MTAPQRRVPPVLFTYLPLAAMWVMMAFEQPLTNAVIGRLPEAKRNLAAFGVAFSLCILVQGPAVQLLVAGTALSGSRASYQRLLAFVNRLVAGLTALQLLVGATPLFPLIAGRLMGVPHDIAGPARTAFLLMSPWPAAVGYRRLWQGVLLRHGRPAVVAATTAVRLLVVLAIAALALACRTLPGASVGAVATAAGMIVAAATTRLFAGNVLRSLPAAVPGEPPLTAADLARFTMPLVFTSLITVVMRPMVTSALSRAPSAAESLAIWPVISSWLFLLQGPALALQETTVAVYEEPGTGRAIRRFASAVAALLLLATAILALPGPADFCFRVMFGLPAELAALCTAPFAIMGLTVPLTAVVSYFRGVLVRRRTTRDIPMAVAVNVAVLAASLLAAARLLPGPGVVGGAVAVVASLTAECAYLGLRTRAARAAAALAPRP